MEDADKMLTRRGRREKERKGEIVCVDIESVSISKERGGERRREDERGGERTREERR